MKLIAIFFYLLSLSAFAHEVQWTTQYVKLHKLDLTGWEHDFVGKYQINQKWAAGVEGGYIERFSLYEKRFGGFVVYKPTNRLSLEAHYIQGMGDVLLPEKDSILTAYYAWIPGIAPFLTMRDARYKSSTLDSATLGAEIEKWPHIIFIPQFMLGTSKYKTPSSRDGIYSYGLRAIYYTENRYSFFLYGYQGKESSEGVNGSTSFPVKTLTGGIGGSYNWTNRFRTELSVEHTDYHELKDQFITTTINLRYTF